MAVVAGAGSGKSETMAARLVWLVVNGLVLPEQVLGLTFTRKAAAELAQRVRARLDQARHAGLRPAGPCAPGGQDDRAGSASGNPLAGDPVIATYHSYAGRLIADHALREAVEPAVRLITPAVCWQLASRVVAAYDGPMDSIRWSPSTVTAAVLDLAGELAEHLRGPGDVREAGEWLRELSRRPDGRREAVSRILRCQSVREQLLPMVEAYARAKAARQVLDYGDQMALAARIASRHPEVGAIERARYRVVLLDEYQDTSHAQLVLLRTLFGGGHPVTAVGDPCQSIYGWRGASAGNLRRFPGDFPGEDGRPAPVAILSTSFRNTGRVLDAAAAIQQSLRAAAHEVPRLIAPPGRAGRGQVICALLETAAAEAAWIAGRIAGLLRLDPGIAPDGRPWPDEPGEPGEPAGRDGPAGAGRLAGQARPPRRVRPGDIAVLCRKRSQFPLLRAALEDRGIPVEVVGLGGLLTVPEVADVVATLRVMHDASASDALARLLTSPRCRIGPRDLVALGRRARDLAGTGQVPDDRPGAAAAGTAAPGAASPGQDRPDAGGLRAGRVQNDDPMNQALTDLTADPGSLVEALDDLGDPAAYSPAGYRRLAALAAELRELRGHAARPLPELVGEVERVLGLDIEVAARPGTDPAQARADLDAFADAAAAFAGDAELPTLGAFLAYLAAAETEEFGLEAGRVGTSDSVKLATVHAAKGLQWAAVFVPGMSAGRQGGVFPARPRQTTRWTDNPRLLPFALRGDAADLPALAGLDPASVAEFDDGCRARELAEERRLAYVAVTRAAFWLACTGYWWGEGISPLGPSAFLREVRAACEAGAGIVDHWAAQPGEGARNPALADPATARWPAEPAGPRYAAVREAAGLVREALAELNGGPTGRRWPAGAGGRHGGEARAGRDELAGLDPGYRALAAAWGRDASLLLAERARRRPGGRLPVELPRRITVSSLVTMAADTAALARQIRRPMPRPPAPQASRGSAFHRWIEQRFGSAQLIDDGELPGAADAAAGDDEAELAMLRDRFEAGTWAGRWPCAVEVPFETRIGDRVVRGRIDAVFADAADGRYDVVDWKTGRKPQSRAERRAVAVQLAAYRLAWAGLAGVPVALVRAAFYYVRDDATVRPADLLDEAGLAALIESIPPSSHGARPA
jgi:DNA helicase-2/ATP-dependent DNA helicase PcrA